MTVKVIQDPPAAVASGLPPMLHFSARATPVAIGVWYGPTAGELYTDQDWGASRGAAADPIGFVFDIFPVVPFDAKIPGVEFWYRPSAATVNVEVALYKYTFVSGAATITPARVGPLITIAPGQSNANRYDGSTAFSADNLVSKGDIVCPVFRPIGSHLGNLHFTMSVPLEPQ